MRPGIKQLCLERIVSSYGHVRVCIDTEIEVHGHRIENHFNRRGLVSALDTHLNELEKFLLLNEKEPESCWYFCTIATLAKQARIQELIEVPDLPNLDYLLSEEKEEKKTE